MLELLLHGLHHWTQKLSYDVSSQHLLSSITLAAEKLDEYLGKTSRAPAWLAALLLNPKYKWDLLTSMWTGKNVSLFEAFKKEYRTCGLHLINSG